MIYIPFLGALGLAIGTILERATLMKKNIQIKTYHVTIFFAIILAMIPFLYFFWRLDSPAFELKNILIFSAVIITSLVANIFVFYSLKWEKITKLEPARILEPLFVIMLALVFSLFIDHNLYERNLKIIIPALVASAALIFPHLKKHHLSINKYIIAAILGSFFFALELIISRLILDFYSPITFYFLRCSSIFLISLIAFRPNFKKIDKKSIWIILITGAIWAAYRIIIYWGYLNYGIIFTTLMVMLGPIFIYILAWKFLKEKISWKNIISALIIIGSVVYAILS
jgi:drug/metabolite transporter (DMT)-like permease